MQKATIQGEPIPKVNSAELLTYKDLSRRLKRSRFSLTRDVQAKRIPFIRIGSQIRFDPQEIDMWLASNSHRPKRCA
ncbi:MAG TPA: helix-turn-helix domain-containing protein [Spirochaetota bacterium]|nr:helix-turn-helix domain-containing protein [Spirochaetota bacterium]